MLACNKPQIVQWSCFGLNPGIKGDPIDYAAMLGLMVYYIPGDAITRTTILEIVNCQNMPIPVFGWDNHDAIPNIAEYNFLNRVSICGDFAVASGLSMGLPLMASSMGDVSDFSD